MKLSILFILLVAVFAFSGCSNPLNRPFNTVTFEQDLQDIRQSNKASDDDIILLAKCMAAMQLSGNNFEGKTYEEMLDNIKKLTNNNKEEAEQTRNDEELKRRRMEPLLNVALLEKKFTKINNKDCLAYTVSFQNTSLQNIKTIIGDIRLNDLLEKQIKKINILLDEEVRPNSTLKKTYTFEYNHGDDNDQRIRSKDLVDLRVEWNPEKIIFGNGKLAE